jgi:hypothetical protein
MMSTETASGSLHFKLDGGDLTRLVREIWADDQQPERAMRILEVATIPPMTYEQRLSVVCGSQRLGGDELGMELAPDDATHTDMGNALTLERVMARLRADQERGLDALQMLSQTTYIVSSEYGMVEIPLRRLDDYKNDRINIDDIVHRCLTNQETLDAPSVRFKRAEILDEPPEPPPPPEVAEKITQGIGWLTPEGRFYACEYAHHNLTARALGHEDEQPLQKMGWIKLTKDVQIQGDRPATQAQLNRMFDFFNELPWWARE